VVVQLEGPRTPSLTT